MTDAQNETPPLGELEPPVLVSPAGRDDSPEAEPSPPGPNADEPPVDAEPVDAPPADATDPQGELALLRTELAALRDALVDLNRFVDTLHAENQQLRARENEKLALPVLRDLIKLRDDWTAMTDAWRHREDPGANQVTTKCAEVADDALLILERYGVEEVAPAAGADYDRRVHRLTGTLAPATADDVEGTVARLRRPGYVSGDRVVRFAEVLTFGPAPRGA